MKYRAELLTRIWEVHNPLQVDLKCLSCVAEVVWRKTQLLVVKVVRQIGMPRVVELEVEIVVGEEVHMTRK